MRTSADRYSECEKEGGVDAAGSPEPKRWKRTNVAHREMHSSVGGHNPQCAPENSMTKAVSSRLSSRSASRYVRWDTRASRDAERALERTITDRFGEVRGLDRFGTGEIGDRPRDAYDAIERARRGVPSPRPRVTTPSRVRRVARRSAYPPSAVRRSFRTSETRSVLAGSSARLRRARGSVRIAPRARAPRSRRTKRARPRRGDRCGRGAAPKASRRSARPRHRRSDNRSRARRGIRTGTDSST